METKENEDGIPTSSRMSTLKTDPDQTDGAVYYANQFNEVDSKTRGASTGRNDMGIITARN